MRLYLLTRKGSVGHGEYDSFVVRAGSEAQARTIASTACGSSHLRKLDDAVDFEDQERSTCEVIEVNGKAEVVHSSYAGG